MIPSLRAAHTADVAPLIAVRMALTAVAFTLAVLLAACNTVDGAGKDIEKGGEAIQDAAK